MILTACVVYILFTIFTVKHHTPVWIDEIYCYLPVALDIVLCVIIQLMMRNKNHQRSIRFVTTREERKKAKIQARENKLEEVRRPGYK